MMNLQELQTAVIAWANQKGIVGRENSDRQFLKFDEESGELSGAIIKNNNELIIDSIGDTLVTLIILAADLGYIINLQSIANIMEDNTEADCFLYAIELVRLKGRLATEFSREILVLCIETTLQIAYVLNLDPAECLEVAYNVISKRKSKTINGVVVKEEDLPCAQ